jgi:ribosomal protein L7/L12
MNPAPDSIALTRVAIAAIESGHLIQAIKIIRIDTGLGLKESKELVEAYLTSHPAIKEKFQANRTTVKITQETVIHMIIVMAGLAVAYWIYAPK